MASRGLGPNGEHIRYLRHRMGLTQEDLANAVKCSKRRIESLEKGEPASLYLLELVAKSLGTTADEIIVPKADNESDTVLVFVIDPAVLESSPKAIDAVYAGIRKLAPEMKVIRVEIGSIHLTVAMTKKSARRVLRKYKDQKLQELGIIEIVKSDSSLGQGPIAESKHGAADSLTAEALRHRLQAIALQYLLVDFSNWTVRRSTGKVGKRRSVDRTSIPPALKRLVSETLMSSPMETHQGVLADDIIASLKRLPPDDMRLLYLYYCEGVRTDEMSKKLGITAAGGRLEQAKDRLRAELTGVPLDKPVQPVQHQPTKAG
jgi:transcriptional regulator with XRE-family HTH domain